MSHKAQVQRWLEEAQERLKFIVPGSAWYRETETIIRDYEKLLERIGEKLNAGNDDSGNSSRLDNKTV